MEVNIKYCIQTEEELLLFRLTNLKIGLIFDALGVMCGMSTSNEVRNQKIVLAVLACALEQMGVTPKRKLLAVEEFNELFGKHKTYLLMPPNNAFNVLKITASKKTIQVKKYIIKNHDYYHLVKV